MAPIQDGVEHENDEEASFQRVLFSLNSSVRIATETILSREFASREKTIVRFAIRKDTDQSVHPRQLRCSTCVSRRIRHIHIVQTNREDSDQTAQAQFDLSVNCSYMTHYISYHTVLLFFSLFFLLFEV